MSVGAGIDAEFTTLVHVFTDIGCSVQLRARGTNALETAGSVATLAAIAEQIIDGAFVNVGAMFSRTVHLVARITDASVRAEQILARSVRAHIRILCAFVNIFKIEINQSINLNLN